MDLQIELLQLQRRVQARVPLPTINLETAVLTALAANSAAILRFDQMPMDWSDLRFLLRSTADAMRTHDAIDEPEFRRVEAAVARRPIAWPVVVRSWYDTSRTRRTPPRPHPDADGLEPLLLQAMRPFLTRSADAIMARTTFVGWSHGTVPICGGEPDFSVITPSAERLLICSRCTARWRFDQLACPFCLNGDRRRITSFATRDGMYRLYGCDVCQRYLKAFDARHASRPVMPVVDAVATLPFDAAAIQRGYK